jgi:O-antigen/teichoic acid export membrane protein
LEPSATTPEKTGQSRRDVIWSVALQALGSCATFAVALVISRSMGLEAQGEFGILKSWADLAVTALMFGLPQGLMHCSYQPNADVAGLRSLVHRYVLAITTSGMAVAATAVWLGYGAVAVVTLAVPGLVFHGLLRSLLLRSAGLIAYALVTIAPAISLLAGVLVLVSIESSRWQWSIMVSSLASLACVLLVASLHGLPAARRAKELPAGLWSASTHNFIFNICVAAQPALLLTLLTAVGSNAEQLGSLSLSFYFLQIFSVLAGFLAPAVYDRFSAGNSLSSVWARDRRRITRVLLAAVAMVAGVIAAMPWIFSAAFQPSYAAAIHACQVMTAAGLLVLTGRLIATVLLACGRFADMGYQALARVGLSVLLALFGHWGLALEPALAAACAVLASEAVVAVWGVIALRSAMRSPNAIQLERPV